MTAKSLPVKFVLSDTLFSDLLHSSYRLFFLVGTQDLSNNRHRLEALYLLTVQCLENGPGYRLDSHGWSISIRILGPKRRSLRVIVRSHCLLLNKRRFDS